MLSEMVRRLYDAYAVDKAILVVPGAGHGESFFVAKASYTAAVEAFIGRHIADR